MELNEQFSGFDRENNEWVEIALDPYTNAQVFVSQEHHEIHEGDLYRAATLKDVPNAGTLILTVVTADSEKLVNFRFEAHAEAEATVYLYENPTSSVGGTALAAFNALRGAGDTPETTFSVDATVTIGSANILDVMHLGSGRQVGGSLSDSDEWILAPNTVYVIRATNLTATPNHMTIKAAFYEHAPST